MLSKYCTVVRCAGLGQLSTHKTFPEHGKLERALDVHGVFDLLVGEVHLCHCHSIQALLVVDEGRGGWGGDIQQQLFFLS